LKARYYKADIYRFLTKDPDGGDLREPVTLNLFAYAGNNPVNLVDADGKIPEKLARRQALFDVLASSKVRRIIDRWIAEFGLDLYAKGLVKLLLKFVEKNLPSSVPVLGQVYRAYKLVSYGINLAQFKKDYEVIKSVYWRSYKYWRKYPTGRYLAECKAPWGASPTGPLFTGPEF
jgi:hypothetical protein